MAEALGYKKTENALAKHVDTEDKTLTPIQGGCSTGSQKTYIINESGVYSMVLSSRKPEAKHPPAWVHTGSLRGCCPFQHEFWGFFGFLALVRALNPS